MFTRPLLQFRPGMLRSSSHSRLVPDITDAMSAERNFSSQCRYNPPLHDAEAKRSGITRNWTAKAEWWSLTESNRRHPACKAGALPAELRPQTPRNLIAKELVGLGRLELPTSRLSSARSNQLSYKPKPGSPRYGLPAAHVQRKKEKRRRLYPACLWPDWPYLF